MDIKELRQKTGLSQAKFREIFPVPIPRRTLENWESGKNSAPEWVLPLISFYVDNCFFKEK